MLELLATTSASNGLTISAFVSTILYTILGIFIMISAIGVINTMFKLDLRHELTKDNNIAYGVAIAGFAIAIGIIIAGTISS